MTIWSHGWSVVSLGARTRAGRVRCATLRSSTRLSRRSTRSSSPSPRREWSAWQAAAPLAWQTDTLPQSKQRRKSRAQGEKTHRSQSVDWSIVLIPVFFKFSAQVPEVNLCFFSRRQAWTFWRRSSCSRRTVSWPRSGDFWDCCSGPPCTPWRSSERHSWSRLWRGHHSRKILVHLKVWQSLIEIFKTLKKLHAWMVVLVLHYHLMITPSFWHFLLFPVIKICILVIQRSPLQILTLLPGQVTFRWPNLVVKWRARCDSAPPIWGNKSPLAAQSKVGYRWVPALGPWALPRRATSIHTYVHTYS